MSDQMSLNEILAWLANNQRLEGRNVMIHQGDAGTRPAETTIKHAEFTEGILWFTLEDGTTCCLKEFMSLVITPFPAMLMVAYGETLYIFSIGQEDVAEAVQVQAKQVKAHTELEDTQDPET